MKNSYVIIGDSIVYGIGGYQSSGWVSLFKNKLLNNEGTKESTNYVHCVGFPGATSNDIRARIDSIINTYYSNDVKNIFIISIGANDTQIFKGENKVNINQYKENIISIITSIKQSSNIEIIFLGLNRIQVKDELFYWKPEKYYNYKTIKEYNNILSEICLNNDIKFIDMLDVLDDNDFIDGLHPNDKGYSKIVEKILLAVKN